MESNPGSDTLIDRDLPCVHCRYNLRTLPTSGKCPECGTPVARSMRTASLAESDARWRSGLGAGLAMLAAGLGGEIMLQVIYGQGLENARVTKITVAVALVLCSVGIWLVTEPEPDPLMPERPWSRRRVVRWSALAIAALYVVSAWLGVNDALFEPNQSKLRLAVWAVTAAMAVIFCLLALHVADLTRRTGRRQAMGLWRLTALAGLASGGLCVTPLFVQTPQVPQQGNLLPLAATLVPLMAALFMAGLLCYTAWAVRFGKNHFVS
jgi:hypothetical protein